MAGGGGNEPNLTPFIDLFSVLICFLLMTAAWVELDTFQVQIEEKPKLNPDQAAEAPPPPIPEEKKVQLSLHLSRNQIIAREDEQERVFPVQDLQIQSPGLEATLTDWRARFQDKQMLVLHSGERATYAQLIRLYDLVTHSGWAEVAINPY